MYAGLHQAIVVLRLCGSHILHYICTSVRNCKIQMQMVGEKCKFLGTAKKLQNPVFIRNIVLVWLFGLSPTTMIDIYIN